MKWYEEKRMQRMNEDGKIDTLSVWSEDSICVPSTAIMPDDLLTNPSNDLLSTFIMGDNVVAISVYDIVVKQGGINGKTKQYKFDYILGNNPDYTSCAHNNKDTIVQLSRGDPMMRIIKITDDKVDISYKEVKYDSSAPMNPTLYAFLVYVGNRFVFGIQRTDTTTETGTYLYWSENLDKFYKADMSLVDFDLDFRHQTNRNKSISFKGNVPVLNNNDFYLSYITDLFADNTDMEALVNFGNSCVIGYDIVTDKWVCFADGWGNEGDVGYCRLCNYPISSSQLGTRNVGVVTDVGEASDELIIDFIVTADYQKAVARLYDTKTGNSILPYLVKVEDKTYIPMGDGEDGQEGKLCFMVIKDKKS